MTILQTIHANRYALSKRAKALSIATLRPTPCYARPPHWLAQLIG